MTIKYTLTARVLHWLTALAIISAFALGLTTGEMEGISPQKIKLINYHKWIGITVLGLVALRLLWRLTHRPPVLPSTMANWERAAAHLAHFALYFLMFAVPLGGWLYSSAKGYPVVWLGLVELPSLMAKDDEMARTIKEMHEAGAWTLIAIAIAHAAAALKHHFIQRDDVLKRML